jgi:hypothetical protein
VTTLSAESRAARLARRAPRVPWQDFLTDHFDWKWGQHLAAIGPTGQGKTTLLRTILPLRPYVVIFATKPRDMDLSKFQESGFVLIDRWRSVDPRIMPKRILWPDASRIKSEVTQRQVFAEAFDKIYREGAWTVAIDELWFIINKLKLHEEVKTYLLQARALDISLVCCTQRPYWVPSEVYDQSTHLFFWRDNDARNQRRLAEINNADSEVIRDVIGGLERHQFLYVDTRTGDMLRSKCPPIIERRVS